MAAANSIDGHIVVAGVIARMDFKGQIVFYGQFDAAPSTNRRVRGGPSPLAYRPLTTGSARVRRLHRCAPPSAACGYKHAALLPR